MAGDNFVAEAARIGIILAAHSNFDSPFVVGSHHIRRELLARREVAFLGLEPFQGLRERRPVVHADLIRPRSYFPQRGSCPKLGVEILRLNSIFAYRQISGASRLLPSKRVLILDNPFMYFVAVRLKRDGCKVVLRLTDWMPGQLASPQREICFTLLRRCICLADEVVVTSHPLRGFLRKLGAKSVEVINNGVDDGFFQTTAIPVARDPNRAIYYGAIDSRFDLACLVSLANLLPDIQFDVFSPSRPEIEMPIPSNLSFAGTIAYADLPEALERYSFGILPFRDIASNHCRFPMKLYEMIAKGVFVVAPPLSSLTASNPIPGVALSACFTAEAMAATLRKLRNSPKLDELRQSMIARSRSETWSSKVNRLLSLCCATN